VVLVALAAVGLVGYGFFSDWRADQQRPGSTALRVGDTKYTVEYFTERLRAFATQSGGGQSSQGQAAVALASTSEQLIGEAIFLRFAADLGQSSIDDDIKSEIGTQLGLSLPVDETTYETVYQAEIMRSGLTESQYREVITAEVLRKKVLAKFEGEVPASAESVLYRQIVVATQSEADAIRSQIEGGADFAQLAKEKSLDTVTKDTGGDAGWVPRGLLEMALEDTLFGLEVEGLATHTLPNGALVLQVTEKEADRAIDDAKKPELSQKAFQDWLTEKRDALEIKNDMDLENGDAEKIRYAIERAYPSA
jgi:foldase protein PrsA